MEVTNDKRREVAERLWAAHVANAPAGTLEEYNDQNSEFVIRLAEVLADVDRERLHYAPYEFDHRPLMDVLADLIDRPTCHLVRCDIDHGSVSWGVTCSRCGGTFEYVFPGEFTYCPNCGAEVVEDE